MKTILPNLAHKILQPGSKFECAEMNICIIDDRGGKIPAVQYGGTERVVWGLGKELARLGHRITYIVPAGSTCLFAQVVIRDPGKDLNEQIPKDTDIVHIHYKPAAEILYPYVVTVHGNHGPDEELDINSIFISKNQAKRYGSKVFVHNGLSWEDYPQPDLTSKRTGFHFLGKASWSVKNSVGAIHIGRKTGEEFHVIGGKKWSLRNIKNGIHHLIHHKIKFHGLLDDNEKCRVMERSKGLIFPVLWHEPFGLAVIESLFAGCAVFGSSNGSLPELVTKEVGFTSNSQSEILKAIKGFEFDPAECHNYALQNFNSQVMALKYLAYYKQVTSGENLNQKIPVYIDEYNTIPEFN